MLSVIREAMFVQGYNSIYSANKMYTCAHAHTHAQICKLHNKKIKIQFFCF